MKRLAAVLALLAACACSHPQSKVEHWVIVGHAAPGVPGTSEADAAKWHGIAIDLGPDLATAGPDSCTHPLYDSRTASGDSVAEAFHIAPGSLGASLPPGATVTVLETSCNGERWYAPGATLIKTSATHAFAPWEGVFFELERR